MINKLQAQSAIYGRFSKLNNMEKTICAASLIAGLAIFANWPQILMYQNGVSYNSFEGPASFNSFAICLNSYL